MANTAERPNNREVENENLKPAEPGRPPRPATEPAGGRGGSNTPETATDPATGTPNRKP